MKIEQIKEFIKDKRNRAIVTLGIYIIFFLLVGIMCHNGLKSSDNKVETVTKTPFEVYSSMSNYEYKYTYTMDDSITNIVGKVYRDNIYMTLNNINYYYNGKIYEIKGDKFVETTLGSLYLITNKDIANYINKGTKVSKSDNFEDGITATKYSIPIKEFDSSLISTDNIYITLYENSSGIYKVDIDLINYFSALGKTKTKALIEIQYSNIEGVSNFTTMFDTSKVTKGV